MTSTETTPSTALDCPSWCLEHYDGENPDTSCRSTMRNHSSAPETIGGQNPWTGESVELELWIERRDDMDAATTETVGILRTSILHEDLELTPEAMLRLAARLSSLARRMTNHR